MISVCRASFAVLCVLAWARAGVCATPERSVSTSRQFLVYGNDVHLRAAICDLAEKTKGDVLRLSDQRDEWITPIVINARYPEANRPEAPRAALNFSQTGFGLKLQLDLTILPDSRQPEVRRELLRAILLEVMYRHKIDLPVGTGYVPPPDWLLDGIVPRQSDFDREEIIDVLRTPVARHKTLPLEEFLGQRPGLFDAPGRSLYRAYSFALVDLLVYGPEGRHRLARFLAGLPAAANDAMGSLKACFPELNNPNDAEKVWRSYLERLAIGQPFQRLCAKETEEKLAGLISLMNVGKSSRVTLFQLDGNLRILGARANPVYCSLIHEYEKAAALLARGKTNGIAERLARLKATRDRIATRAQEIDDYMNWFEATQPRELSGAFVNYLKAAELMFRPEKKRRDPISVYLDVLEAQFQN